MNLTGSGGIATIDTTGGNISLAGNLMGSGTLDKVGPGTLLLSGTNSNFGSLNVNGGVLKIRSGSLTAVTEYVGSSGTGRRAAIWRHEHGHQRAFPRCQRHVRPVRRLAGRAQHLRLGRVAYQRRNPDGRGTWPRSTCPSCSSQRLRAVDPPAVIVMRPMKSPTPRRSAVPAAQPRRARRRWCFPAATTYSGATTIAQGAVELANANAVENSTVVVDVNNGLLFAPNIGTFNVGGLSGSSSLTLSDTAGVAVTMAVGGNDASTTYSGAIGGNGGLVKAGSGDAPADREQHVHGRDGARPGHRLRQQRRRPGCSGRDRHLGGLTGNIIFAANSTLQASGSFPWPPTARSPSAQRHGHLRPQGYTLTIGA